MTFCNEHAVKAVRKNHFCEGCGKYVLIGEPAIRWTGIGEDGFASVIYHPECREAEVYMNREINSFEWCPLNSHEEDDWPWLMDKFPAVAARFNITPERYKEYQERYAAAWHSLAGKAEQ